jgi:hypothetical protein
LWRISREVTITGWSLIRGKSLQIGSDFSRA